LWVLYVDRLTNQAIEAEVSVGEGRDRAWNQGILHGGEGMTPEDVQRLFAYNTWAMDHVWECVEQLSDEQFVQAIDYSMGSVRNQMLHIVTGIERWLQRLEGEPPTPGPGADDFPSCSAVRAWWVQTNAALGAYLKSLDQEKLDETVGGRLAGRGVEYANKRSDLLLHMANHCTDHRAQVLAILHSEFDAPTVEQDLLLYLIEAAKEAG
jgi:uncharacterized damage-inducible protein DinB